MCILQKAKPYKTMDVVLDVTLECERFEFRENFILYEMHEVNLILDNTFFEAHTIDVRWKLA